VAQILKRIGTTEATNLLATEYSDVDYENSIYYEDFSEDQDEGKFCYLFIFFIAFWLVYNFQLENKFL
jgi:hypothetical protein